MIALRLAECVGLNEEERSVVYYAALMVDVGCHSDAHEQAKWFGDDIALKSGEYDHQLGSMSATLATKAVNSVVEHPLPRLIDAGVFVTSNSDDPATFASPVPGEYAIVRSAFAFIDDQPAGLAAAGIGAHSLRQA
jgi:adenosine deaminase